MTVDNNLTDTIKKLELMTPINSFKFGHTPLQIEFFQTSNQQGNEKWEYLQHILQLRSLHTTLCELKIAYDETTYELEDADSFWPIWTRKKRNRSIPRFRLKLTTIQKSIAEKTREVDYHLEIIDRRYKHLKALSEDDIISDETSYWASRLGRQLGASHLGKVLGVSESELLAVLSLPQEQQRQVFEGMRQLLGNTTALLPQLKQ